MQQIENRFECADLCSDIKSLRYFLADKNNRSVCADFSPRKSPILASTFSRSSLRQNTARVRWALHSLYSLLHRVYIHQCPFKIVKDWNYTVMIYSIILLQYIKGPSIHLSYVDRRTDVFCLVNKWNCMHPIVARLNPVVNKA